MEAGNLLRSVPLNPHISSGHRLPNFRQFVRVSNNLQVYLSIYIYLSLIEASIGRSKGGYRGGRPKRELISEWISNNDDSVRSLPIYVGGISLFAVLFNRTVSGIAPVADASSSQSRADLLTIGLAVTNILAGLVWLSIRPKTIFVVPPRGVECERIHSNVPDLVASELIWYGKHKHATQYVEKRLMVTKGSLAWESLSATTCSRSLVIVYDGICVLQIGYASASSSNEGEPLVVDADKLMQGSIYQGILKSGSQSYLANLSLYPGKSELPFLPSNTQAVILQPLGDKGIAILGGDTIRGFTSSDQPTFIYSTDKAVNN
ncbi:hypothetical protein OSB04_018419 [Centaurea solstitialis]|uniref:Uncharacterized protein n=1 Tax=Centaurea solstitialis TaxID=347529 RepID=A0AA38WLQ0_9ASTR|nr:hypothetical protein OSB04_018419 [Centaurea solstitialis]